EEYMVEYAADRVETMSTVWLGMTMGCTRCHNHKYDPLTQKDYYSLFAYFNNIPDRGRYFKFGNTPPFVPAPTPDQEQKLARLEERLQTAQKRFEALKPVIETTQREWENSLSTAKPVEWAVSDRLKMHVPLSGKQFDGTAAHDAGKTVSFG